MRSARITLLVVATLVGCNNGNRYKVANPVMPDAPPRRIAAAEIPRESRERPKFNRCLSGFRLERNERG